MPPDHKFKDEKTDAGRVKQGFDFPLDERDKYKAESPNLGRFDSTEKKNVQKVNGNLGENLHLIGQTDNQKMKNLSDKSTEKRDFEDNKESLKDMTEQTKVKDLTLREISDITRKLEGEKEKENTEKTGTKYDPKVMLDDSKEKKKMGKLNTMLENAENIDSAKEISDSIEKKDRTDKDKQDISKEKERIGSPNLGSIRTERKSDNNKEKDKLDSPRERLDNERKRLDSVEKTETTKVKDKRDRSKEIDLNEGRTERKRQKTKIGKESDNEDSGILKIKKKSQSEEIENGKKSKKESKNSGDADYKDGKKKEDQDKVNISPASFYLFKTVFFEFGCFVT